MRLASALIAFSLLSPSVSQASSIHVRPDGTGAVPTIQAAVDASADGDTILLSAGTFVGVGNVNVDSRSKSILLVGAGAANTTIDCAWTARAFKVHDNNSSFFIIAELTITRGWGGTGGAIQCLNAAVALRDVTITRSIACWGRALGCVDGQALIVRSRLLNNTCVTGAPCYGAGAPVCEGLSYGGPVSVLRSSLEMIDSYCEGNAHESSQAQVVYALDSSLEMTGNRFFRNITFDGGPVAYLEHCTLSVTANEFVENAAWTSGVSLVNCSGEVRGNVFDGNNVHVGPGGIAAKNSTASLSFNLLTSNGGESISIDGSNGYVIRNLIVGTRGSCCTYGTALRSLGCESPRVANNTFFNNGVGSTNFGSEVDLRASSYNLFNNLIVHDELDVVVRCNPTGCSPSQPASGEIPAWLWGYGALYDAAFGSCLSTFQNGDPLHRDVTRNNFFLRPGSECDMDTTISSFVLKRFFGALPKGSRPSGLVHVAAPPESWPGQLQLGSTYTLTGFAITNTYRYDASINYRVTSPSGLLRDGGNPLSLVGATPVLAPGESFTPPEATIVVPAGNRNVVVKYSYAYAPALNIVDTIATAIHFVTPLPVRVTSFTGRQEGAAVKLEWTTGAGSSPARWRVYRAAGNQSFKRMTEMPLRDSARSYVDARVAAGVSYRYRLVALDADEIVSGEVSVTPHIALTLDQNTPNPFHSVTTLRFSIPEPARATLAIYGVDGGLVRMLLDEQVNDAAREVVWDGRDVVGREVSSGVYFARLVVRKSALTRKIVLAR